MVGIDIGVAHRDRDKGVYRVQDINRDFMTAGGR